MKRTEFYTQTKPSVPYGDFGLNCIEEMGHQRAYFWFSSEGLIRISLEADMQSRITNALEVKLEIMPADAQIPRELKGILEKNKFIQKFK